jgi:hypothetical protein
MRVKFSQESLERLVVAVSEMKDYRNLFINIQPKDVLKKRVYSQLPQELQDHFEGKYVGLRSCNL